MTRSEQLCITESAVRSASKSTRVPLRYNPFGMTLINGGPEAMFGGPGRDFQRPSFISGWKDRVSGCSAVKIDAKLTRCFSFKL